MSKYQTLKKQIGWAIAVCLCAINILLLQNNSFENVQQALSKLLQVIV